MIGVQDFCGHYEWTFKYIEETYGKEALEKYWSEAIAFDSAGRRVAVLTASDADTLRLTVPAEWVAGASMMVRREVLEDVGPMDDRFFLYYEEADYQLRARRAGWSVWHVSDAHVVHIMGASTGVTGEGERVRRRPRPR